MSPPFFQLPAYLPGGRELLSPPASRANGYLTQGEHCWRAVLPCPAVVWPEAQAATRPRASAALLRCRELAAGSGETTGAALTAAGEMRGVLRQPGKDKWEEEGKKTEVKEKWRREVMKQTKIQNKGMGGKMHKRQETGRKKTSGVKIHHGIRGEGGRFLPAQGVLSCRRGAEVLLGACSVQQTVQGGSGADTGEERPCIFRVNKASFQTSAS